MRYTKALFLVLVGLAIVVCPYRAAVSESEALSNCHSQPEPMHHKAIKACCDNNGLLIQEIHAPDLLTKVEFQGFRLIESLSSGDLNSFERPLLFRTNTQYLACISVLRL